MGNNLEKKKQRKGKKKQTNDAKALTLTGLLMEGVICLTFLELNTNQELLGAQISRDLYRAGPYEKKAAFD